MTEPTAGWWLSQQLDRLADITEEILTVTNRIDRRSKRMSAQESALNEALVAFFGSINDGLARIEAKLAEAAPTVDLTDEVAAIHAAQEAFTARVDADVAPPPPPPTP